MQSKLRSVDFLSLHLRNSSLLVFWNIWLLSFDSWRRLWIKFWLPRLSHLAAASSCYFSRSTCFYISRILLILCWTSKSFFLQQMSCHNSKSELWNKGGGVESNTTDSNTIWLFVAPHIPGILLDASFFFMMAKTRIPQSAELLTIR